MPKYEQKGYMYSNTNIRYQLQVIRARNNSSPSQTLQSELTNF